MLAIAGCCLAYLDLRSIFLQAGFLVFNIFFLLVQFILLQLYFLLKGGKTTDVINKKIGWGDVLFLVAACFFFSPLNFILFYIQSLIFSTAIFLVMILRRRCVSLSGKMTVPLAGLQASFLFLDLAVNYFFSYSLTNDNWMMSKLVN
jgi:hypothetical protein